MIRVGAWLPLGPAPAGAPGAYPMADAVQDLSNEGIEVIFGEPAANGFRGLLPLDGGWTEFAGRVDAVYDRYSAVSRAAAHTSGLRDLGTTIVGNAPDLNRLCTDKLGCQRALEAGGVECPEVVRADHAGVTLPWPVGYLKPRFGSFGEGVRRLVVGDSWPCDPGWILQRAIEPPPGWAGVSVRALVQRDADGTWTVCPLVVRRSRTDPVVNAARGAEVVDVAELPEACARSIRRLSLACAQALAGATSGLALELGVDLAVDHAWRPHVIEVNGRPRGRLAVLAKRWPARYELAWRNAVNRPFRALAGLVRRSEPVES